MIDWIKIHMAINAEVGITATQNDSINNPSELEKKIGVSERTVWGIEKGSQNISNKFVDKLLLVYPEFTESIEVQFDWISLTLSDLTPKKM